MDGNASGGTGIDIGMVILDASGVLRDSSVPVYEGYRLAFQNEGMLLDIGIDAFKHVMAVGKYNDWLPAAKLLVARAGSGEGLEQISSMPDAEAQFDKIANGIDRDKLAIARNIADRADAYRLTDDAVGQAKIIPKVTDAINLLFANGYQLAICSNSRRATIENELAAIGLERFFTIVAVEDVQIKKPDGEGIKRVIQQAGAQPQDAAYVGDCQIDILAARDAGCLSVGVLSGYSSREQLGLVHPDFIFDDLYAFASAITKNI
jgi:HAD superfamily hydrolase (TIGR01509 family)